MKKNGSGRFKSTITALEQRRSLLEQQVLSEAARQRTLQFKADILASWLGILDLLQQTSHKKQRASIPEQDHHQQHLDAAVLQLLRDHKSSLNSRGAAAAAAAAATTVREQGTPAPSSHADPLLETIGAADDPVAFFRGLALRPLAPETATMTALQHLQRHRELAMALSINLHKLELRGADQHNIMSDIQQLLFRHYHMLWSLIIRGRLDVTDATKLFDLDSGTLLSPDSPLLDHQDSIKDVLLPELQLSEAQEDQTAYAMELCESLMAPICAEIAAIQEQLDACVNSSSSSIAHLRGGADSDADASSAVAGEQGAALAAAEAPTAAGKALLERQQALLRRLDVVFRKQYHVAAAGICIFLSGLTWLQAARMVVLRWPFSACMQYVAKAVWLTQRERVQRQQHGGTDSTRGGSNVAALLAAAAAGVSKLRSEPAASELL